MASNKIGDYYPKRKKKLRACVNVIVFLLKKKAKNVLFERRRLKKNVLVVVVFLDFERVTSIVDEAGDLLGHNSSFLDGGAGPAHAIDRRSSHNLQTQGKKEE